jgi:hypothetical protein
LRCSARSRPQRQKWKPFSAADFAEAQKQGKSILVDIFAP